MEIQKKKKRRKRDAEESFQIRSELREEFPGFSRVGQFMYIIGAASTAMRNARRSWRNARTTANIRIPDIADNGRPFLRRSSNK